MSGNSFGEFFRLTTFGESHGYALGAIIDGMPPGMPLQEEDIQIELNRRKTGQSRFTSQRREPDLIQILSGVFEGKTTGTSIGLLIQNKDHRSKDYSHIAEVFRPGHADYTYFHKYDIRDYRGGGRSSARETVMRVAAGAIAKKYLQLHCGIQIRGCVTQIGPHQCTVEDWDLVDNNPFAIASLDKVPELEQYFHTLRKAGDSCGALIYLEALQVPVGLGDPVFAKLDALLAYALMGVNAVKAVEIGDGFQCVTAKGSEFRDDITTDGFQSNHAGGILGGISSGQTLTMQVAFKPTPSILIPGRTITTAQQETVVSTKGRHDPCVGLRAVPICEAMIALVLMDRLLAHRAQNLKI